MSATITPTGMQDGAGHGGLAALAPMIATLLEEAGQAFDHNPQAARDFIARARTLIAGERAGPPAAPAPTAVRKPDMGAPGLGAPGMAGASMGGLAPWQMRRVSDYIDANLDSTIANETLAGLSRLSRSHFCAAFRRSFGASPRNFIIDRRIERAKSMMLEEDTPLAEVATVCGFSDQAYFCRIFRRATGETPHRWRRQRQGGASGAIRN